MKSIYEVALNILIVSLQDPQDEGNVCYTLNLLQMNVIIGALKQAQKQEKLLELYRELSKLKDDVIHLVMFGKDYEHLRVKTVKIEQQIKELENEII